MTDEQIAKIVEASAQRDEAIEALLVRRAELDRKIAVLRGDSPAPSNTGKTRRGRPPGSKNKKAVSPDRAAWQEAVHGPEAIEEAPGQ